MGHPLQIIEGSQSSDNGNRLAAIEPVAKISLLLKGQQIIRSLTMSVTSQ
jgi:hypothetical protein